MPSYKFNRKSLTIYGFKKAFSLIELLIVISIFGMVTAAITVSYVSFEQSQRLSNAAKLLKTDIRYVQNQALVGDKSTPNCTPGGTLTGTQLWGWYIYLDTSSSTTTYSIYSDCILTFSVTTTPPSSYGTCNATPLAGNSIWECWYPVKTVTFPTNVSITSINPNNPVSIMFRPVQNNVTLVGSGSPPFISNSGGTYSPTNVITLSTGSALTITLGLSTNTSSQYYVRVYPTGEVNETHN